MNKTLLGNTLLFGTLIFVVMSGCKTIGPSTKKSGSIFPLSVEEHQRLERYRALTREIEIDDFVDYEQPIRYVNPYTQAYEGYRILRLFGLHRSLSLPARYECIRALYSMAPTRIVVGAPVRNIIIPGWFVSGDPLIFHVSQAYTGSQQPVMVVLTNTASGIRKHGYPVIQRLDPAVDYPRFVDTGTTYAVIADEQYSTVLFPDGRVSASGALGHQLPAFDELPDSRSVINLSDAYLRDEDMSNDDAVVEPLLAVASNDAEDTLLRVHARLQLFMYHLFQGDLDRAERTAEEARDFMLGREEDFSESGTDELVLEDAPSILKIAHALETGNEALLH